MNIQIIDLLVSTTGIVLIGLGWYLLWRPLAIAHLRQDLFDARDFLFDLVANGETTLKFDSKAYRGTREDLNRMIRFAGHISLFSSCLWAAKDRSDMSRRRAAQLRAGLSSEESRIIDLVDDRQQRALADFLLSSSPFIVVTPLLVARGVLRAISRFSSKRTLSTQHRRAIERNLFTPTIETVEIQSGQEYLIGHHTSSRSEAMHACR